MTTPAVIRKADVNRLIEAVEEHRLKGAPVKEATLAPDGTLTIRFGEDDTRSNGWGE
ncbi:MAG: hypothetical protein AAF674_12160 [Pseudomonadota bacterium]